MMPESILRDALSKIVEQRRADATRAGEIGAELVTLEARIRQATRAETALEAILAEQPVESGGAEAIRRCLAVTLAGERLDELKPPASAPKAQPTTAPQPKPKTDPVPQPSTAPAAPPAPTPPASNIKPVELQAAIAAVATVGPKPPPATPTFMPKSLLKDQGDDDAIRAAKDVCPGIGDRKTRILAAAATVRAFSTVATATALRFDVLNTELAPSQLRKAGISEEQVVAVAQALAPKRTATAKPASEAKVPEAASEKPPVSKPIDVLAEIRDLANDLHNDLPAILATSPTGVSVATIADWLGCTHDQARAAAVMLIQEGKAVASNQLLRLPTGEAVPA